MKLLSGLLAVALMLGSNARLAAFEDASVPDGWKPDVDFQVSLLSDEAVPLPTDRFSVRQMNSLWHGGKYYVYADIIGWDNPKHPDSYGSSIGVYSSPDGRTWTYHGIVVAPGKEQGDWDFGGVATPGAIEHRGKFYIAYSARERKNGLGNRPLGLAVADKPLGPFRKMLDPIFPYTSNPQDAPCFDDPCLVKQPGSDRIHLYYRHARWRNRTNVAYDYSIRLRTMADPEQGWSSSEIVLRPSRAGHTVLETIEAKWINGQFVLVVLDYLPGAAMHVSTDGIHFQRCRKKNFREHVKFTRSSPCTHLPGLLVDGEGVCRFMNTSGVTDNKGHFTQWIYPVRTVGGIAKR